MTKILGIDPGTRNLGLVVVDTEQREVLASVNVNCGSLAHPATFAKVVWREISKLHERHGIEEVKSEAPPYGLTDARGRGAVQEMVKKCKVVAGLHRVMGAVDAWAIQNGVRVSYITPQEIKNFSGQVIGLPYSKWPKKGPRKTRPEKKWGVREAATRLANGGSNTDHEADAVVAAFYGTVLETA